MITRAAGAAASPPPAINLTQTFNRNDPRYSVRLRTPQVIIKADGPPLSPALARGIANEVGASLAWQTRVLGWGAVPGIKKPVEVFVTTAPLLRELGMSVGGGVAMDDRTFVMSRKEARRAVTDGDDYRLNTEAHEGLHVLQMRVDRQTWNPTYFYEGLACLMSNHWAVSRLGTVGYLREEAQAMAALTPAVAARVMREFRSPVSYSKFPDMWTTELAGALALEFFRTRYGGKDGFQKLGAVLGAHGKGVPFAAAFEQQFGVPLAKAEAAFVQHVSQTQGDAAARLRGTVWSGYA
jgi:hypothetical protein